jgi:hypothetical protein
MRRWVTFSIAVATGFVLASAGTTSAKALTDGLGVLAGSGTTSPGLSLTPTAQSIGGGGTLAGAAFVGGNVDLVDDACSYSGATDIQSTLVQSDGNLSASCSGTVSATAALHYTRTGPVVEVQGTGTINSANVFVNGACAFVPTSAPTVQTYLLACALLGSDTA